MPNYDKRMLVNCRSAVSIAVYCLLALLPISAWALPRAAQTNDPAGASQPQTAQKSPAQSPAETPAKSPDSPRTHPPHAIPRRQTLDDRVKAFATALDLSENQQVAVKKILEQRGWEILRLRQDTSISGSDRIGRLRALQDETVQRIRAVLTDDQKKKYDPLAIRQIPPSPDQKSLEDWLKATTPK